MFSFETIILVVALSLDAFIACFAYGTNKIKIPILSIVIINIICCLSLILAIFLSYKISPFINMKLTKYISFMIFLILGIVKLFDSALKNYIRSNKHQKKEISFSIFSYKFILNIYANPVEADRDYSLSLSPLEAISLAVVLSLDGIIAGLGFGLANIIFLEIIILSFLLGFLAILGGYYLGKKISKKITQDLSWLSGILLILLGINKII